MEHSTLFAPGHRACAGCGAAIALNQIMKAAGPDTIVISSTGCMEVVSSPYPQTAWKVPWIHSAFENAGAIASGIDSALRIQGKREEINIIVIAGDGATFDIGFQALSGAIERGHKFTWICYDNEAYENTGVQRSGATPYGAWTTTSPGGKKQLKKPMPQIIAAHKSAYVATASIAYPFDFSDKIKKALKTEGVSYIQVLSPCVPGWKIDSAKTVQVAKIAVESGIYPLYEIIEGKTEFKKIEKPRPVQEYLALQGRFKKLSEESIATIQENVNENLQKLEKQVNLFKL